MKSGAVCKTCIIQLSYAKRNKLVWNWNYSVKNMWIYTCTVEGTPATHMYYHSDSLNIFTPKAQVLKQIDYLKGQYNCTNQQPAAVKCVCVERIQLMQFVYCWQKSFSRATQLCSCPESMKVTYKQITLYELNNLSHTT